MINTTLVKEEPVVYYMRDNHTFRRLEGNVQQMIDQCIEDIRDHSYSHGSIFCKIEGKTVLSIQSNGIENLAKFVEETEQKLGILIDS